MKNISPSVGRPPPETVALDIDYNRLPAMSRLEKQRFELCEKTIEEKLAKIELEGEAVAELLLEIRDKRYYREHYDTWEAYCAGRWNRTGRWGRQLLNFAEVKQTLKGPDENGTTVPADVPMPTSERQTRPLSGLAKEEQRAVWTEAVEAAGGKVPTGKQVEDAKSKIKGPKFSPAQIDEWINDVESWFKPGDEITIAGIMGHPRSNFNSLQGPVVFDAMVDRGLIKNRRLVETWPRPNEHGVYNEGDERVQILAFHHAKASAEVRLLQINESMWVSNIEYSHETGDLDAVAEPLTAIANFVSREEALRSALTRLRALNTKLLTENERHSEVTPKQKRIAQMIIKWANRQLRELCGDAQETVAKAPATARSKRPETDPAVLKLAKRIYNIGAEAAGFNKPWANQADTTVQFLLAVARWHLAEIASLAAVVDEEAELRSRGPARKPQAKKRAKKADGKRKSKRPAGRRP